MRRPRLVSCVLALAAAVAALALPVAASAAPGDLYVSEPFSGGTHGAVVRVNSLTGAQSILTQDGNLPITDVEQDAFEPGGNVLVAVSTAASEKIVRVNAATGAQSIVSSGGDLVGVFDLAVGSNGDILASTSGGKVVKVNPTNGAQTIVIGSLGALKGIDVAPNGDIFVVDHTAAAVKKVTGGVASTFGVGTVLANPQGLARAGNGDIYVANRGGSNVVRIPANGSAGAQYVGGGGGLPLNEPVGIAFAPTGNLYVSDASPGGTVPAGVVKITPAKAASVLTKGIKLQDARGIAVDTTSNPDTTAPVITKAKLSNTTFRVDKRGAAAKKRKKAKKGTTISYTLSEAATTTFTVERRSRGRKVKGVCVKQTRKNRKKRRCTRYKAAGSFTQAAKAGANTKPFSGRIGTKSLKPGSYRLTLVAKDAAGNSSKPSSLRFKIVR